MPTRAAEPGKSTLVPSAFDDSLKWGALVHSVDSGAGPKLERAEMIYSEMVNRGRVGELAVSYPWQSVH